MRSGYDCAFSLVLVVGTFDFNEADLDDSLIEGNSCPPDLETSLFWQKRELDGLGRLAGLCWPLSEGCLAWFARNLICVLT